MPKDATKNVDSYKTRGGHLNEFEYAQNREALAEQQAASKQAAKKPTTQSKPQKGAKKHKRHKEELDQERRE